MSAVVPPMNSAEFAKSPTATELRLEKLDAWCEKWSDRFNPILVKETRQALKSRQFVITFSLLLFAALSWTIFGTFSLMPAIYTSPSAPRMMLGYYFVLALPMLLVVPLAAYRSLEGEIDDGTLELLSITSLSPRQIILGKLASAMLQMLLYFVVLFPCISYAYTLRGVDFPTTVALLGMLLLAGVMMTIVALFFATLSQSRTGRVTMLLVVILLLFAAEWVLGLSAFGLIEYGVDWSFGFETALYYFVTPCLLCPPIAYLLFTLAAAQLTPASENRSTKIRVALLLVNASVAAWIGFGIMEQYVGLVLLFVGGAALIVLWTLASSMLVAESAVITPRVQRDLPQSFFARATLGWLAPGPETGLVFAVINMLLLAGVAVLMMYVHDRLVDSVPPLTKQMAIQFVFGCIGYLTFALLLVYGLMRGLRRKNTPRVEVGFAAMVVVAVFAALAPFAVELYANDFMAFPYSQWQATNWVWTLSRIADGKDHWGVIEVFGAVGVAGVVMVLYLNPSLVRPRRTATPERVIQEMEKAKLEQK